MVSTKRTHQWTDIPMLFHWYLHVTILHSVTLIHGIRRSNNLIATDISEEATKRAKANTPHLDATGELLTLGRQFLLEPMILEEPGQGTTGCG